MKPINDVKNDYDALHRTLKNQNFGDLVGHDNSVFRFMKLQGQASIVEELEKLNATLVEMLTELKFISLK